VLLCKDHGVTPDPATKALLKGVFTPPNINVAGRRFNIGDMNYTVLEQTGPGEYKVQCETAGSIGDQYLGAMLPIDYIKGLQTAELTEILIPGRDEEDTEVLRKRYFESFDAQAFGGNRADYIAKVRGISGVGAVKVTPVWNGGIRPADMIPSDAVKAWYESTVKTMAGEPAAWLSAVYAAACGKKLTVGGAVLLTILDSDDYGPASDALVDSVQTILDPTRNAGEGFGWGSLQGMITGAVDDYLLELRRLWADGGTTVVRVSQIESRILAVKGVADITGTTLNGKADNLTLGEYEVPVAGGVGG